MAAQRGGVRVLRGAVPRRDVRPGDAPACSLLPVQHRLSLSVAERAQRGRIPTTGRLRREGDARHHRPAGLLRLHAARHREHARHLRVCAAYRSVASAKEVMFSPFGQR